MFEGWVADLLTQWLGSVFEESCIRPDRVKTSVYSGHVVLSELEFKKSFIESIWGNSVTLKRGFIGKVEFQIPWHKLGSKPFEIWVDGVFLLLEPDLSWTEEKYEKKTQARKQAELKAAELLKRQERRGKLQERERSRSKYGKKRRVPIIVDGKTVGHKVIYDETGSNQDRDLKRKSSLSQDDGFTTRLLNKIMDNIELHVRNVHIRYEDRTSDKHPFSFGATLESLEMKSTDASWKPAFVDLGSALQERLKEENKRKRLPQLFAHKLFKVDNFAIYCQPIEGTVLDGEGKIDFENCTFTELEAEFERLVPKRISYIPSSSKNNSSKIKSIKNRHGKMKKKIHHFILCPVNALARMRSNRDPRFMDTPNHVINMNVDTVEFVFDRSQYKRIWLVHAAFLEFDKKIRVHYPEKFRPAVPVGQDPKAWWRFAIQIIRESVRKRRRRFTGSYITQRRNDRLEYMMLWKRRLAGVPVHQFNRSSMARTPTNMDRKEHIRNSTFLADGTTLTASPLLTKRHVIMSAKRLKDKRMRIQRTDLFPDNQDAADSESTGFSTVSSSNDTTNTPSNYDSKTMDESETQQVQTEYLELDDYGKIRLQELEKRLRAADILFFRSLAENQLQLEKAHIRLLELENAMDDDDDDDVEEESPSQTWSGSLMGWMGWATGIDFGGNASNSTVGKRDLSMTIDEQERLLEMLDFDPVSALERNRGLQSKPGHLSTVFKFHLDTASLELWDISKENTELLVDAHFVGLDVGVAQRANTSSEVNLSLDNVEVYDRLYSLQRKKGSKNTKKKFGFDRIVAPKATRVADHFSVISESLHSEPNSTYDDHHPARRRLKRHSSDKAKKEAAQARSVLSGAAAYAATLGSLDLAFDIEDELDREQEDEKDLNLNMTMSVNDHASNENVNSPIEESRSLDGMLGVSRPGLLTNKTDHVSDNGENFLGVRAGASRESGNTPVFSLKFDTFNPDGNADVNLTVRMQPLEIVYSPMCFARVSSFFKVPAAAVYFKELQFVAINSFSSTHHRNEAKVEYAYRNHFSVSVDVDVQAPVFIIPEYEGQNLKDFNTKLLLIDFGRLTIRDRALSQIKTQRQNSNLPMMSNPITGDATEMKVGQASTIMGDNDINDAFIDTDDTEFYDEYEVCFKNVQVLVTNVLSPWRSPSEQKRLGMHLVDQFTLKVATGVSILPYDRTLPQLKMYANLPSIRMHLSPEKYLGLLSIFNSLAKLESLESKVEKDNDVFNSPSHEAFRYEDYAYGDNYAYGDAFTDAYVTNFNAAKSVSGVSNSAGLNDDVDGYNIPFMRSPLLSERIASPAFGYLNNANQNSNSMDRISLGPSAFLVERTSNPIISDDMSFRNETATMNSEKQSASSNSEISSQTRHRFSKLPFSKVMEILDSKKSQSQSRFPGLASEFADNLTEASMEESLNASLLHNKRVVVADGEEILIDGEEEFDNVDNEDMSFYSFEGPGPGPLARLASFKTRSVRSFNRRGDDAETYVTATPNPFLYNTSSITSARRSEPVIVTSISSGKKSSSNSQTEKPEEVKEVKERKKKKKNVSLFSCGFTIASVTISLARERSMIPQKKKKNHQQYKPYGDAEKKADDPAVPRGPAVVTSYVREWLEEVQRLGVPPMRQGDFSESKINRRRHSSTDQVLDEILSDCESAYEKNATTKEEEIVQVVLSDFEVKASLRSFDTTLDVRLEGIRVEDMFNFPRKEGKLSPNVNENWTGIGPSQSNVNSTRNDRESLLLYTLVNDDESKEFSNKTPKAQDSPDPKGGSLLRVKFVAISKMSKRYAGVGAKLDIWMQSMNVVLRQDTFANIYETLTPVTTDEEYDDITFEKSQTPDETKSDATIDPIKEKIHQSRIIADVKNVGDTNTSRLMELNSGDVRTQVTATLGRLRLILQEKTSNKRRVKKYRPPREILSNRFNDILSNRFDSIADISFVQAEMCMYKLENGISSVSARLGNLIVRDLTACGASNKTKLDFSPRPVYPVSSIDARKYKNNKEPENNKPASISVEEKTKPILRSKSRDIFPVEVFGSYRPVNDSRPLMLFNSLSFGEELSGVSNCDQATWTVSAKGVETQTQGEDDETKQQNKHSSGGIDPLLMRKASIMSTRSHMNQNMELDLDEIIDQIMYSPPSTPESIKAQGERNFPFPDDGFDLNNCEQGNEHTNYVDMSEEELLDVPVPEVPLQREVSIDVRLVRFELRHDLLERIIKYLSEGELMDQYRERQKKEMARKNDNLGTVSRAMKSSSEEWNNKINKNMELNSVRLSLSGIRLEIPGYIREKQNPQSQAQRSDSVETRSTEEKSRQKECERLNVHLGNIVIENSFILADTKKSERFCLAKLVNPKLIDGVRPQHIFHIIERVDFRMKDVRFYVSIIQDWPKKHKNVDWNNVNNLNINAKLVRPSGAIVATSFGETNAMGIDFNDMELMDRKWWRWQLAQKLYTAGFKCKVDVSELKVRLDETKIVAALGIAEELGYLTNMLLATPEKFSALGAENNTRARGGNRRPSTKKGMGNEGKQNEEMSHHNSEKNECGSNVESNNSDDVFLPMSENHGMSDVSSESDSENKRANSEEVGIDHTNVENDAEFKLEHSEMIASATQSSLEVCIGMVQFDFVDTVKVSNTTNTTRESMRAEFDFHPEQHLKSHYDKNDMIEKKRAVPVICLMFRGTHFKLSRRPENSEITVISIKDVEIHDIRPLHSRCRFTQILNSSGTESVYLSSPKIHQRREDGMVHVELNRSLITNRRKLMQLQQQKRDGATITSVSHDSIGSLYNTGSVNVRICNPRFTIVSGVVVDILRWMNNIESIARKRNLKFNLTNDSKSNLFSNQNTTTPIGKSNVLSQAQHAQSLTSVTNKQTIPNMNNSNNNEMVSGTLFRNSLSSRNIHKPLNEKRFKSGPGQGWNRSYTLASVSVAAAYSSTSETSVQGDEDRDFPNDSLLEYSRRKIGIELSGVEFRILENPLLRETRALVCRLSLALKGNMLVNHFDNSFSTSPQWSTRLNPFYMYIARAKGDATRPMSNLKHRVHRSKSSGESRSNKSSYYPLATGYDNFDAIGPDTEMINSDILSTIILPFEASVDICEPELGWNSHLIVNIEVKDVECRIAYGDLLLILDAASSLSNLIVDVNNVILPPNKERVSESQNGVVASRHDNDTKRGNGSDKGELETRDAAASSTPTPANRLPPHLTHNKLSNGQNVEHDFAATVLANQRKVHGGVAKISANLTSARVVFVDDSLNQNIPVFDFQVLYFKEIISITPSILRLFTEIEIAAEYHNHRIGVWEPLVEPWSFNLNASISSRDSSRTKKKSKVKSNIDFNNSNPNSVSSSLHDMQDFASMNKSKRRFENASLDTFEGQSPAVTPLLSNREDDSSSSNAENICPRIKFESKDTLNVNLTEGFLESIRSASRMWTLRSENEGRNNLNSTASPPKQSSNTTHTSSTRDSLSMFRIRNETGLTLAFWTESEGMVTLVESGEEHPLFFDDHRHNTFTRSLTREKLMSDNSTADSRRSFTKRGGSGKQDDFNRARMTGTSISGSKQSYSRKVSVIIHSSESSSSDSANRPSPWMPVNGIPVDREGSYVYRLSPRPSSSEGGLYRVDTTVSCDVVSTDAFKLLTIRSPLLLRNRNPHPMDVIVPDLQLIESSDVNSGDTSTNPTHLSEFGNSNEDSISADGFCFKYSIKPEEIVAVPLHVASLVIEKKLCLFVRPVLYNTKCKFSRIRFPSLSMKGWEAKQSIRKTIEFEKQPDQNSPSKQDCKEICLVEYTSGNRAVEALSSESSWGDFEDEDNTVHESLKVPSAIGSDNDSSGISGAPTSRLQTKQAEPENIIRTSLETMDKKSKPSSRYAKKRIGLHVTPSSTTTSLRLVTFDPPVLLSNLLACPMTYRLRCKNTGKGKDRADQDKDRMGQQSWASGHLPVGASFRWQGIDPSTVLTLAIRLPGFEWSSTVDLKIVETLNIRESDTKNYRSKRNNMDDLEFDIDGDVNQKLTSVNAQLDHDYIRNRDDYFRDLESQNNNDGSDEVDKELERDNEDNQWSYTVRYQNRANSSSSSHGSNTYEEVVELRDADRRVLRVCVQVQILPGGTRKIVLYVPYWIVNLSDHHLLVRSAPKSLPGSSALVDAFGAAGQYIAAGQNDAIHAMRRLRMRQKLDNKYPNRTFAGYKVSAPGGLLDLLDENNIRGDSRTGEPLMFSYTDQALRKGRVCLRTSDSTWSKPVGLDSAGTKGLIELKQKWSSNLTAQEYSRRVYVLGVSIAVAEGKFHRTKVMTISPRFLLINALGRSLKVKQRVSVGVSNSLVGKLSPSPSKTDSYGVEGRGGDTLFGTSPFSESSIRPGERVPFHWYESNRPREICVCFDEYGWTWSGGFAIDNIGDFAVRLRNQHTHAVYILRVDVTIGDGSSSTQGSTVLITFRPELPKLPPYRIDNLSLQTLRLRQIGTRAGMEDVLLPYHSCPYTWDNLSLNRKLVVEALGNKGNQQMHNQIPLVSSSTDGLLNGSKWHTKYSYYLVSAVKRVYSFGSLFWNLLNYQEEGDFFQGYYNNDHARPLILGAYELDRLQSPQASSALPYLTLSVHADGPTRVLSVVDSRIDHGHKQPFQKEWKQNVIHGDELDLSLDVSISMAGLGLSVVESGAPSLHLRRELLYLSVSRIEAEFGSASAEQLSRVVLKVGHVQIDNQLYGTYYPVLLSPRATHSAFQAHEALILNKTRNELSSNDDDAEREEQWGGLDNARLGTPLQLLSSQSRTGGVSLFSVANSSPGVALDEKGRRESRLSNMDVENSVDLNGSLKGRFSGNEMKFFNGLNKHTVNLSEGDRPVLECCLVRSHQYPSLDFVRYFSALMLPLDLNLEPELVTALLGFISRVGIGIRSPLEASSNNTYTILRKRKSPGFIGPTNVNINQNSISKLASPTNATLHGTQQAHRHIDGRNNPALALSDSEGLHNKSSERHMISVAHVTPSDIILSGGRQSVMSMSVGNGLLQRNSEFGDTYDLFGGQGIHSDLLSPKVSHNESKDPFNVRRRLDDFTRQNDAVVPRKQRKLYIEELHLHPAKIHVSFSFRSSLYMHYLKTDPVLQPNWGSGYSYSASMAAESDWNAFNPLKFALNAMGATLANVENAPLRLNALVLHNSLGTPGTILGRILAHYRSQALRQAYLILGSADLLGDPLGLVKNLGIGVLDFFYEPALGLVKSPKDFGAGIAKGTLSLFKRTLLATATSATGFVNGVSAIFEALSNDRYTGYRPRSIGEGIVQGLAGMVVSPMNGFLMEGGWGFFRGFVFGVAGIVVKPGAGLLQMVHRVSIAIRSTIDPTVKLKRHRVRPPRFFGPMPVMQLSLYSYEDAEGEEILARVDHGRYRVEGYLSHMKITARRAPSAAMRYATPIFWTDMVLICSRNHLLYVKDDIECDKAAWVIPIGNIRAVDISSLKLRLVTREEESEEDIDLGEDFDEDDYTGSGEKGVNENEDSNSQGCGSQDEDEEDQPLNCEKEMQYFERMVKEGDSDDEDDGRLDDVCSVHDAYIKTEDFDVVDETENGLAMNLVERKRKRNKKPKLNYWKVKILSAGNGQKEKPLHVSEIICWSKETAQKCTDFVNRIQESLEKEKDQRSMKLGKSY